MQYGMIRSEEFIFRKARRYGPAGISYRGHIAEVFASQRGIGEKAGFVGLNGFRNIVGHAGILYIFVFQGLVRMVDQLAAHGREHVKAVGSELIAFHGFVQAVQCDVDSGKSDQPVRTALINRADDAHNDFAGDGVLIRFDENDAFLVHGGLVPGPLGQNLAVRLVFVAGNHQIGGAVTVPDGGKIVGIRLVDIFQRVFHAAVAVFGTADFFLRSFGIILPDQVVGSHLFHNRFILRKIIIDFTGRGLRFRG